MRLVRLRGNHNIGTIARSPQPNRQPDATAPAGNKYGFVF
jgi:hypothetical protein